MQRIIVPRIKFVYSFPYDRTITELAGKKWDGELVKNAKRQIILLEKEWVKNIFSLSCTSTILIWLSSEVAKYAISSFTYISFIKVLVSKLPIIFGFSGSETSIL